MVFQPYSPVIGTTCQSSRKKGGKKEQKGLVKVQEKSCSEYKSHLWQLWSFHNPNEWKMVSLYNAPWLTHTHMHTFRPFCWIAKTTRAKKLATKRTALCTLCYDPLHFTPTLHPIFLFSILIFLKVSAHLKSSVVCGFVHYIYLKKL